MKKIFIKRAAFLALTAAIFLSWVTPTLAVPPLPITFFGTARDSNGSLTAAGAAVVALAGGVIAGQTTTFLADGKIVYRLDVVGDDPDTPQKDGALPGEKLEFTIDGVTAKQTAVFQSGTLMELNLEKQVPPAPAPVFSGGGGGGGGGSSTSTPVTSSGSPVAIMGFSSSTAPLALDAAGKAVARAVVQNTAGTVVLTVPEGTLATDENKQPLSVISATPLSSPPSPPPGRAILFAYNLFPGGARFNPPISLTMKYDPAKLPPGAKEANLVVAFWDGTKWVEIGGKVDTAAKTVTADVSHFTEFAIITGQPSAPSASGLLPVTGGPTPAPTPVQAPTPAPEKVTPPQETVVTPPPSTPRPPSRETIVVPPPATPPPPPAPARSQAQPPAKGIVVPPRIPPVGGVVISVVRPTEESVLQIPGARSRIIVPPLALSEVVQYVARSVPAAELPVTPEGTIIRRALEVRLYNAQGQQMGLTTTSVPVTIEMALSEEDLSLIKNKPERVEIFYLQDGDREWDRLKTTVDLKAKVARAQVSHFSYFALAILTPAGGGMLLPAALGGAVLLILVIVFALLPRMMKKRPARIS